MKYVWCKFENPSLYIVNDNVKKLKYNDIARVLNYDNTEHDIRCISDMFETEEVPQFEPVGEVNGVWRLK